MATLREFPDVPSTKCCLILMTFYENLSKLLGKAYARVPQGKIEKKLFQCDDHFCV